MLSRYSHSVRPAGDDDDVHSKPASFGKLLSADNIIASPENAGLGGEQTALHVRDHYSGISLTYPQGDRTEDSNYKSLKHFAGEHLNGSAETVFKSDTAEELTNAAHRLAWNIDPSLANSWPHNAACERDIRALKETSRPSHLQAGFGRKLWPLSLAYAAKARSFYELAPIHDFEKGTDAETAKLGKSKWEAATGAPFEGVKCEIACLAMSAHMHTTMYPYISPFMLSNMFPFIHKFFY